METRICKECGRELPLEDFHVYKTKGKKKYYTNYCIDCFKKIQVKRVTKSRQHVKELAKVEVTFERKYKEIHPSRILDMGATGIQKIAPDESAVLILDAVGYYITNYSRCIHDLGNGRYTLLKGSRPHTDEWSYRIVINKYIGGRFKNVTTSVNAYRTVIQTFIVNYDMRNNVRIWHLDGDLGDGYYKHLYPVTEIEYGILEGINAKQSGHTTEADVLQVVNSHHFDTPGCENRQFIPTVCGHGFLGCGKGKKGNEYRRWYDMLVRCFSEKFQQKYPTYKGCVVEEEWLNYSNFKIWWKRHKYVLDKKTQMDLDHDILGYGRKLYSAETCAVVPQQINDLVTYRHTNNTGNPIGVWYNKDVDRWWAKVSFYGKQKLVGTYRTKKEAEEGYKKYKRKFIQDVVRQYEGRIPLAAYERLMDWRF